MRESHPHWPVESRVSCCWRNATWWRWRESNSRCPGENRVDCPLSYTALEGTAGVAPACVRVATVCISHFATCPSFLSVFVRGSICTSSSRTYLCSLHGALWLDRTTLTRLNRTVHSPEMLTTHDDRASTIVSRSLTAFLRSGRDAVGTDRRLQTDSVGASCESRTRLIPFTRRALSHEC
jgi:hypothetical protein